MIHCNRNRSNRKEDTTFLLKKVKRREILDTIWYKINYVYILIISNDIKFITFDFINHLKDLSYISEKEIVHELEICSSNLNSNTNSVLKYNLDINENVQLANEIVAGLPKQSDVMNEEFQFHRFMCAWGRSSITFIRVVEEILERHFVSWGWPLFLLLAVNLLITNTQSSNSWWNNLYEKTKTFQY